MRIDKKIGIFLAGFILAGTFAAVIFPREEEKNRDAVLKIGAGDDISGVLAEETVRGMDEKYIASRNLENTSFQDC